MAYFTKIIVVITVLSFVCNSGVYGSMKRRIDFVERRLNYLEMQVNTENIQRKSEIYFLEESISSLNSSLNAFNEDICPMSGMKSEKQKHVQETVKKSYDELSLTNRNKVAETLGFRREKQWLRQKMKASERLFDKLNQTHNNRLTQYEEELAEQETAISDISSLVKNLQERQDYLEQRVRENVMKELQLENAKFRERIMREIHDLKEELISFNQSTGDKYIKKPSCPPDWMISDKHCYYYDETAHGTFSSAREYCQKLNAYIADVESSSESNFIYGLTGNVKTWAGVSDEQVENVWISERTNHVVTYTNWRPGDPDGARSQNCVMLGFAYANSWHQWIDRGCENEYRFVCKKEPTL